MKSDKSRQGFPDPDIKPLLEKLNSSGFKTTSSCSGRIVLLKIPGFGEKRNSEWLYKTHKKADPEEIIKILRKERRAYFLQEPLIMHLDCPSLQEANRILNIAKKSGLKHSGITGIKDSKISLEIRGNERLETILQGNQPEYVRLLVEEANKKLERVKKGISRLMGLL